MISLSLACRSTGWSHLHDVEEGLILVLVLLVVVLLADEEDESEVGGAP